jgi:hypothetical protein
MHSIPYVLSVAASAVFLLIRAPFFPPDVSLAEGLSGVALALRHILYEGLPRYWADQGLQAPAKARHPTRYSSSSSLTTRFSSTSSSRAPSQKV